MKSPPPEHAHHPHAVRFNAAAAADATGAVHSPASILLSFRDPPIHHSVTVFGGGTLEAIGAPAEVDHHPLALRARTFEQRNSLLIPGLVNAHTHLDLTHIRPRPYDPAAGFDGFVDIVRRERLSDPDQIAQSVRDGIAMSLLGGVVAVGDIAGAPAGRPSMAPFQALAQSLLTGVSFVEFFAIGTMEEAAKSRIFQLLHTSQQLLNHPDHGVRIGLQPHAPTTVSRPAYQWLIEQAFAAGVPLSTHLAETPGEHEFIARGTGPHRRFLEAMGLWNDAIREHLGQGQTPVEHLCPVLAQRPFLCAHVNDASDTDIEALSHTPTSIAYCPRASSYFHSHEAFGPHRYREMLAAGVNVCLGTDSIINLPAGTTRLSTLDEARFLFQRDATPPLTLLAMATVNGARALGLPTDSFTFTKGKPLAGLVAVPIPPNSSHPLRTALSCDSAPHSVYIAHERAGT